MLVPLLATQTPALDPSKTLQQYAHRIWGQEEGLFQPTVYSILQTRDGFLWLGTQDSLIRFDGLHFREYAGGDSPLHGTLIRSLLEDKQGRLWVGSIGGGVVRMNPDGSHKQYAATDGLPGDNGICLDSGGKNSEDVWACTDRGLVRFRAGVLRVFTTVDGLPSNQIRATCQDVAGTRWVAGFDFGLSRSIGSRFQSYSNPLLPATEPVNALACGSDGSVWVGKTSGLVQIQGARGRLFTSQDGLPDNEISALYPAPHGALWVGSNRGISRFQNGEISVYRVKDGLSHSLVLSLFMDREGTLWAGTKDGLDQFTDGSVTPYTVNEGLLSNDVGPVLEDAQARLWIGTLGGGLNILYRGHFTALTRQNGLLSNTILSLALDPGGDLWVGTASGLNRLHDEKVVAAYTRAEGLSGNEVRSLFIDAQSVVWAGTERGLNFLHKGAFAPNTLVPGPSSSAVVALGGGQRVRLFASLDRPALYLLQDNGPTLFPVDITHPIDCYFLDPALHSAWMGTLGSGLLRWRNGNLAHVRIREGLYDNRIYGILKDGGSNFWLSSSKGIFRVSERELDQVADGTKKMLVSLPFSTGQLRFECQAGVQPAACRTHDGRLWFSTTSGLVVIDPNRLHQNQVAPPVSITSLLVNGQRRETGEALSLKPWETNNVEIRYAGLSFVAPEKVTFRYRLEGYDKNWILAGTRREAFYTNLPPGHFSFQVMARNADGVWSGRPAAIAFDVQPRLFQRWWFWPVLVGLLAVIANAVYRLRIRRLRQRFELVLAERNRIARELHDTLLQGLSGITMQLQAIWARLPASREKQFLKEVIADAGRCSTEARQSLWGLRTASSSSAALSERLLQVAGQAVQGTRVRLISRVQPITLRDRPDLEFELLRIAQEALSNCVKHAGAQCITLILEVNGDMLSLRIEDDGTGFDSRVDQRFGHFGLQGMRERAAEIGAQFDVASSGNQGTAISVSLKLSHSPSPGEQSDSLLPEHLKA